MSDFVPNNRHLQEVLIFFFHSKETAAEAHRELQKVYGGAALRETTCRDWFRRFKDDDFDGDGRPREERREKWPQYEQRHEKVILEHDNARSHVAQTR